MTTTLRNLVCATGLVLGVACQPGLTRWTCTCEERGATDGSVVAEYVDVCGTPAGVDAQRDFVDDDCTREQGISCACTCTEDAPVEQVEAAQADFTCTMVLRRGSASRLQ